jgi:hypothetical protein
VNILLDRLYLEILFKIKVCKMIRKEHIYFLRLILADALGDFKVANLKMNP